MKYNKLILILLLFSIATFTAFSQQGSLKGFVVNADNKTGLAGAEIADASGRVLTVTSADGSFSMNMSEGKYIIYVNLADFDQAVIETEIKSGETSDAGTIQLKASAGLMQDMVTININEGDSEDGFETQSVQGVLSASSDAYLSAAAYTFGPLMFRVRGYESNYTNVSLNGFVVNDIE